MEFAHSLELKPNAWSMDVEAQIPEIHSIQLNLTC